MTWSDNDRMQQADFGNALGQPINITQILTVAFADLVVREVFRFSDPLKGGRCFLSRQESRQQELQPSKQEMEVITGGGQHGVNGIAGMVCEIIAAHAVLGLEMTDHWFDGGAPPQLTFDLRCEPALLA